MGAIMGKVKRLKTYQHLEPITKHKARQILKEIFLRNGYVRLPDEDRLESEGYKKYKKGFEVRLYAQNREELRKIRNSIIALGYKLCKTFLKQGRIVQPLYGRTITMQFQKLRRGTERDGNVAWQVQKKSGDEIGKSKMGVECSVLGVE